MNKVIRLFFLKRTVARLCSHKLLRRGFYFLLLTLAACSAVYVYNPNDKRGDLPRGDVASLGSHIPEGVTDVKLIFVHGVGDHCPGYALSGQDSLGWFSTAQAAKLGLHVIDAKPHAGELIYSNEFLSVPGRTPHPFDDQSYVALRTQNFTYGSASVHVEAIEVTWSPLTQWVKNDRLADDFTKPGSVTCLPDQVEPAPIKGAKEMEVQAPGRLLINRSLKEGVLDRNLADAAIYMGQYHIVMQLGLADALCHALTGQPVMKRKGDVPNPVCDWRKGHMEPNTRYIFVTHSLGSRLLYDTLLALMHTDSSGVEQAVFQQAFPDSDQYVNGVMSKTPVIYMMANQLTFLGMANISADDTSKTAIYKPAVVGDAGNLQSMEVASQKSEVVMAQKSSWDCNKLVFCQLALAKRSAKQNSFSAQRDEASNAISEKLEVVAFHDTDDLLSWPVPTEYQRVIETLSQDQITFTNVYVRNALRLLVLEWPTSAHQNYFTNPEVWNVINCGVTKGILNSPCK